MAALAAGFQSFPTPFAATNRARFFNSWLRRIAPDTHLDQANGDEPAGRPGGVAAPEERWCRTVSNGFITDPWLPVPRRQSLAGSRCRRSALLQIGDGIRHPIQTKWLAFQSPILAHRCRRNSCEAASHVKRLALLQNVEAGPRQFVRQRLDRHHVVGLGPLAFIETLGLGVVT